MLVSRKIERLQATRVGSITMNAAVIVTQHEPRFAILASRESREAKVRVPNSVFIPHRVVERGTPG